MSVRIGIVDWGEIAHELASHFAANSAELAGVVSRRNNLGLSVPEYRDLDEMLPHVDAVTIAAPNHLQPTCASRQLMPTHRCSSKSRCAFRRTNSLNLNEHSKHSGAPFTWATDSDGIRR